VTVVEFEALFVAVATNVCQPTAGAVEKFQVADPEHPVDVDPQGTFEVELAVTAVPSKVPVTVEMPCDPSVTLTTS
jgi:hypothetical protein